MSEDPKSSGNQQSVSEEGQFKSVMERVVTECFPDEQLVFAECSEELIEGVFSGRDITQSSNSAGEFAWVEEVKTGISVGKSILELVGAMLGVYKVWKELRKTAKEEEKAAMQAKLRSALTEAGVSSKKIDKVTDVVLSAIGTSK